MLLRSRSYHRKTLGARITPKRCRLAAFAFFALLVAIGAIPGEAMTLSTMVDDKLLHFAGYSSMTALIYFGLVDSAFNRAAYIIGDCIASSAIRTDWQLKCEHVRQFL